MFSPKLVSVCSLWMDIYIPTTPSKAGTLLRLKMELGTSSFLASKINSGNVLNFCACFVLAVVQTGAVAGFQLQNISQGSPCSTITFVNWFIHSEKDKHIGYKFLDAG